MRPLLPGMPRPALIRATLPALWLQAYFALDLHTRLQKISRRPTHRLGPLLNRAKIRRRFLTGAHLGYLISRYLLHGQEAATAAVHRLHGKIFASWGVAVIALDHCLDQGLVPDQDTRIWFQDQIWRLSGLKVSLPDSNPPQGDLQPPASGPDPDLPRLAAWLGRLCHGLLEDWRHLPRPHPEAVSLDPCQREFSRRAADLLKGQWRSLEQFRLCEDHNWAWYSQQILDQKTLNFFLAPLALYCWTPEARERFARLHRFFLSLNQAYLHWQLMDDVADLEGDTLSGCVTGPGFLLISQGQLAATLHNLRPAPGSPAPEAVAAVARSRLLPPHLHPWSSCPGCACPSPCEPFTSPGSAPAWDSPGPAQWARCALANHPGERDLDLEELCRRRLAQKEDFMASFRAGRRREALGLLMAGGTSRRLLDPVTDPRRREVYRTRLREITDPDLLFIMGRINRLMGRAADKARRFCAREPGFLNPRPPES